MSLNDTPRDTEILSPPSRTYASLPDEICTRCSKHYLDLLGMVLKLKFLSKALKSESKISGLDQLRSLGWGKLLTIFQYQALENSTTVPKMQESARSGIVSASNGAPEA
ncbi:hypothetical protein JCGZ_12639 [Jatropha curcas]|uniref:Uncharacterized protein n=1 Tax=Jatropha curcas TaxID=180498 RepID=A0A067KQP0_JATCU|nr:hypothetical protein JCGZ_12639 [Jatropha curcas]